MFLFKHGFIVVVLRAITLITVCFYVGCAFGFVTRLLVFRASFIQLETVAFGFTKLCRLLSGFIRVPDSRV